MSMWDDYGLRRPRSDEGYDQMQVCINGHQITDGALRYPQHKRPFCQQCGARTIDSCERCSAPIPGEYHVDGVFIVGHTTPVPKYCAGCGSVYPWQEAAIDNLKEIARESGLDIHELRELDSAIFDIVIESPRTSSAALKLKRLLPKLGKPLYDVAMKVVSDVASETAKKMMGI